ncbi:hypothetical protein PAGU2595_027690 [Lysobacter xanthus]
MKILAIAAPFFVASQLLVPILVANDPEPLGAYAGLYLFFGAAALVCSLAFLAVVSRRPLNRGWTAASLAGAVGSSGVATAFWLVLPSFALSHAWLAGLLVAAAVGAAVPNAFRAAPNNSSKPTPLRGAA